VETHTHTTKQPNIHPTRQAIWVGSYHAAPPWSSRPLPDLLPTVAGLSQLSEVRLLQGLRRTSDIQQLALVTWMPNLVTLGLHDTIVTLEDLLVLARCKSLASLSVRVRGGLIAYNRWLPDSSTQMTTKTDLTHRLRQYLSHSIITRHPFHPAADESTRPQVDAIQLSGSCHGPVMMRRLGQLRVNVMNLGQWSLDELFPSLVQLGPFKDTLGPR
jgi:hypothetical protein